MPQLKFVVTQNEYADVGKKVSRQDVCGGAVSSAETVSLFLLFKPRASLL